MKSGPTVLIIGGFLIFLCMLAIIFIPAIFGSMEPQMNLTNNTSMAIYNQTTPILEGGRTLLWAGAFMIVIFMFIGLFLWLKRR